MSVLPKAGVQRARCPKHHSSWPHRANRMKQTMDELLALLACPETGCTDLSFEGDPLGEGVIRSAEGRVYPVIEGAPRMLPGDLLKPFLEERDPTFTTRWPEVARWLEDAAEPDPAKLETLLAYSFQHVDLGNQVPRVEDWHGVLTHFLDGVPLDSFGEDTVLDVGCGGGGGTKLIEFFMVLA